MAAVVAAGYMIFIQVRRPRWVNPIEASLRANDRDGAKAGSEYPGQYAALAAAALDRGSLQLVVATWLLVVATLVLLWITIGRCR
jgi:hypothetical protein